MYNPPVERRTNRDALSFSAGYNPPAERSTNRDALSAVVHCKAFSDALSGVPGNWPADMRPLPERGKRVAFANCEIQFSQLISEQVRATHGIFSETSPHLRAPALLVI